MSLFIDNAGDSTQVFSHMFGITRNDASFGTVDVPGDPTVQRVVYTAPAGAPATAQRLSDLAATPAATQIVVTAVAGGLDPYSGFDVTGNGFTYTLAGVIRVVYDFAQCNGSGIFVFDTSSHHISLPNLPLLYHELSHAWRAANGTSLPNDEPPAETDENVMRSELHICLRDVNNHGGGCGSGSNCGGEDETSGCFIVSATTGAPDSLENLRLKRLRDGIVRATALGAGLLDEIYRDYYRFSPRIAAELREDTELREQVLRVAVRPLLAWYALAGVLALQPADAAAAERAAAEVVGARAARRYRAPAAIAAIRAGRPVPADAPEPFPYLASRLAEAPSLEFARWAIFDALEQAYRGRTPRDAVDRARAWIVRAPLERLPEPEPGPALETELALLAAGPLAERPERHAVGARLTRAWPGVTGALRRHDFTTREDTP